MPNHTNTAEFEVAKFRPHGDVTYQLDGVLLRATATGPFNAELVTNLYAMAMEFFPELSAKGAWANLAVFKQSALCSPEVLHELSNAMGKIVALGLQPTATAFVLSPDVEGASIMRSMYTKAYADAGLSLKCFESEADALSWLNSVLVLT